jgi:hypothetical protein
MDISYQVATYLASAGFGTLNSSIFVGQIPDNTNGIWIERIGGQQNNYVPVEESAINIFVKNTDASEGLTLLTQIKNYIHRMHNTSSGNAYIYSFLVLGNIEDVQRDVEYTKVYKLTIQVVFRDTTVIS